MLFRNKITSLGQRRGFSSLDIQKLNKLYQCQNLVTCKDFYTPQSGLCQTWKTKGGCERSFHISCFPSLCLSFTKKKNLHICSAFFFLYLKKAFTHWGRIFKKKKIMIFLTVRENLARSYKFENCSSWGDLCRIHKLNEFCCQNTIHNIIEIVSNIDSIISKWFNCIK